MNDKTKIVGIAIGVIAIILSVVAISRPTPEKVIERITKEVGSGQALGALTSPDIPYSWFSFGGVRQWAVMDDALTSASTTVCSLQSPAATTTLVSATARLDTTTGIGAGIFEMGKAVGMNATTTSLGYLNTATGGSGVLVASSTANTTTFTDGVMPPSQWINFRIATSSVSATFAPTGRCSAVFREL